MPAKKKNAKKKAAKKKRPTKPVCSKQRLWLMYPPKLIREPIIWELITRFGLKADIRQAEVRDEVGIVCLELDGERDALRKAARWMERKGVKVEPVEISVIES
tara:strand:- start:260 stop:568 length:309 start_codon:yes stop_codon:yes gene_type:complete